MKLSKLVVSQWDNSNEVVYELETVAFISHNGGVDFDGEIKPAFIIHFMDESTATFIAENWTIEFN